MPSRPGTITVNLPGYQRHRGQWRREINLAVRRAAAAAGVTYGPSDCCEVVVLLYLTEGKRLTIHDVDTRLKDILDALQGRFLSAKSKDRLIDNDRQVCRVLIEKQKIPKHLPETAGGKLMVRPYRRHRWPLQPTKGHRLWKT